jgi:hypothetical protein
MGAVSLMRMEYLGGYKVWLVSVRLGSRRTYVVEHFVHSVEAGEEAPRVRHRHFVGNAWITVFSADNAVISRVEAKFNCLVVVLAVSCPFELCGPAGGHKISPKSTSRNTQQV